jgi:hypothetical protein
VLRNTEVLGGQIGRKGEKGILKNNVWISSFVNLGYVGVS